MPRRPSVKHEGQQESKGSLADLFHRIAERGRLIPPDVQDDLSRRLRESDYCLGSEPLAHE
jgi:hypothetical protein